MKIKFFRFHLDAESGQPHIYDHGVTEAEVEEVFWSRYFVTVTERSSSTGKLGHFAMGQTSAGRVLKILYSPDSDGIGIFVVTAYDLTGKGLRAFRRRIRRRNR